MGPYRLPQNGSRCKAGNAWSTVDNARYIDSLRGHLDTSVGVSARYCNAANIAHEHRLCYKETRNDRLPAATTTLYDR